VLNSLHFLDYSFLLPYPIPCKHRNSEDKVWPGCGKQGVLPEKIGQPWHRSDKKPLHSLHKQHKHEFVLRKEIREDGGKVLK